MFFDISLVSFTVLIKLFDCVLIAWKIEKNIFRLVQEMEMQVCSSRKSQQACYVTCYTRNGNVWKLFSEYVYLLPMQISKTL